MEENWITALAAAMGFGVLGTTLGGVLGVALGTPKERTLACVLNATAGLMIAVVCFELLPEAYALHASFGVLGLILGVFAMMLGDAVVARRMEKTDGMARAGLLLAAGVALHNLPEGLAVGSGYAHAPQLGVALALMIALHDVPEGLAAAVPMRISGASVPRVLLITALSGVPTGLGALLGLVAGGVSQQVIALSLGFAGGAMLQVTAQELLPRAGEMITDARTTLCLALGVAAGSIVALYI